jgi:hypothetical protein
LKQRSVPDLPGRDVPPSAELHHVRFPLEYVHTTSPTRWQTLCCLEKPERTVWVPRF